MPDDLSDRVAQDRARISLSEEHEVYYWTKALGVSRQKLKDAIEKVGNLAEAVRREPGK
ncbi:MAG: DUF3606 domain-containing protein [Rhizobiales bacterium]|jgi:hypothetical protein|nr:DUF3606 domain-containing protein [Hyphomicrobiales bacterium]